MVHVPSITAHDLLLPPNMLLGMLGAMLHLVQMHFTTGRKTQLTHLLRLDLLFRMQRYLCIARANLFCCSAAEVGLVGATSRLQDLVTHTKELSVSEGSKRAAARAAKRTEAATAAEAAPGDGPAVGETGAEAAPGGGPAVGEAQPSRRPKKRRIAVERPPKPRSLCELWHAVARDLDSVIELRALMLVLGLSTSRPGTNERLSRSELETSFSAAMGARRDPVARALAVSIMSDLEEPLVEELREAEAAVQGEGGEAAAVGGHACQSVCSTSQA